MSFGLLKLMSLGPIRYTVLKTPVTTTLRDLFDSQAQKNLKMSSATAIALTITVQLPTGDHFICPVRAFKGKARFPLHAKKIVEMAHRHIGSTQNEYRLAVLFGDEEEVLTTIFQRKQPPYSPDELQECVARSIQTCNCWAWCEMERERVFTRDTIVHIRPIPLNRA